MIRTVVAFSNSSTREKIAELLEKNGIKVRCICKRGIEVVRDIKKMGGGVVICSPQLHDMTADDLAFELGRLAFFLVAGRPAELDLCEDENIFRLKLPAPAGEICGSVRILTELDERRSHFEKPERSSEESQLIRRAKEFIMDRNAMSEEQAYRFIQKRSMETSTPMVEIARLFLANME